MTAHFTAIRGSRGPSLEDTLATDGTGVDLTGRTVTLRLQHGATREVVEYAMTVTSGTGGEVFRDWDDGDLDIRAGTWWGQYRVSVAGGGVEIWPTASEDSPCNTPLGWHGLEFVICPAIPAP